MKSSKVALVTGGAKRIGAAISRLLHQHGYRIIIHYHHSSLEATNLVLTLNTARPNSAAMIQADLQIVNDRVLLAQFVQNCCEFFGGIDVLVHNASSFYATNLHDNHQNLLSHWQDLFLTNAKAPFMISQAFLPILQANKGSIISLLDIHADGKPFVGYPIYNMAKAAHRAMVQSLALEIAPLVRINGVAPGVNILPENDQNLQLNSQTAAELINSVPLSCIGTPNDIAEAVLFLVSSRYITGQILAVDGGRSLTLKGG
ncbi:pteridine reductase [Moraxella cuniculi DSM 21768]|uniref:Pteridine reductase n=1 Tax=Moraxella cuniculi DSM 21768 TaxID=1122245 RepID=A0A1N7D8I1_9GAMM|nr:pteridine reductase [Moraxella cuniculi]OOS07899.1 pteridine reductase [Moraxella cuniculi]SIR72035.1 pteridine reductase [Moraxella cuniculi DSM 21768]